MSVAALTWSFNLVLRDLAGKAVLHVLADHADEQGMCWPSMRRLSVGAGCEEKTARRAIARLVALGIISRDSRPGTSDIFRLNMNPSQNGEHSQNREGSISAPLPRTLRPKARTLRPTPLPKTAPEPSEPSRTPNGTPIKTPEECFNEQENKDASRKSGGTETSQTAAEIAGGRIGFGNGRRSEKNQIARPIKLPCDWRPSQECRDFALDLGLDPEGTAEAFLDYWTSEKGSKTKRVEWERTWRVWCRNNAGRTRQNGSGKSRSDQRDAETKIAIERGNAEYERLFGLEAKK